MITEFSKQEYKELDGYLNICGANRQNCRVFWDNDDKLIFAKYKAWGDKIHIRKDCQGVIKYISPCIVHELTHRRQKKRAGLTVTYWLGLTFLRPVFEKEAVAAEKEAERLLSIEL